MPTYEYECTACGRRHEVFQRIDDDPLTTCEECGGDLRKLFHPVGIAFRGSGFYKTDSRSSGKGSSDGKTGAKKDGAASGSGGKKKDGGSKEKNAS